MRAGHNRERVGDGLHLAAKGIKSPEVASADTKTVHICFQAIFQGDHAGVEIATEAHEQQLKSKGLLVDSERILFSNHPFTGGMFCHFC